MAFGKAFRGSHLHRERPFCGICSHVGQSGECAIVLDFYHSRGTVEDRFAGRLVGVLHYEFGLVPSGPLEHEIARAYLYVLAVARACAFHIVIGSVQYEFSFGEIDYCICLFLVVEGDDVVAVHCIIHTEGGFQAGEEGFSVRFAVVWNCTVVCYIVSLVAECSSLQRG